MKGAGVKAASVFCATLLMCGVTPPPASAQSDSRVAVGMSFSQNGPSSNAGGARGNGSLGFLWRFGQIREGWGVRYGLNWYSADLRTELAGREVDFGKLKLRPFMAGYGYTTRLGSATVSANMMAGYAINSFSVGTLAGDMYRQQLGGDAVETDVTNTVVLKPEMSLWLDLTRKIALNVDAGYMLARPSLTVRTPAGEERRHVNADMFMFKVGAVYSLF